jgi:hypothetical protein
MEKRALHTEPASPSYKVSEWIWRLLGFGSLIFRSMKISKIDKYFIIFISVMGTVLLALAAYLLTETGGFDYLSGVGTVAGLGAFACAFEVWYRSRV